MSSSPPTPDVRSMLLAVSASIALALPPLLAFNLPPSSTFLNQAAALAGWGAFLTMLAGSLPSRGSSPRSATRPNSALVLQAAFALVLMAAIASPLWSQLPGSLAWSSASLIVAAALVAHAGAVSGIEGLGAAAFRAFCIGLLVAGILSSAVGIVQVFAPTWADGNFIARTYIEGRAVGNMRQPNHLSSLLLWAIVAVVWLGEARVVRRSVSAALALLFVFVVVLSASRTGALSMVLLLAWGAFDKRLSREARWLLCLSPLVYGVFWYGTGVWADHSHHVFGGETRFTTQGDISSSRWGIWSNTLALIRMHPWAGVGFGEFNFAWTLTPFPGRPVAFFDHTHNIVLQFLVELGIPLGTLVSGLLGWALWIAFGNAFRGVSFKTPKPAVVDAIDAPAGDAVLRPAAFSMVLLIMLHSLLEYPLWYAYYLLPAAFAFGLCLGEPGSPTGVVDGPRARRRLRPLVVASLLLTMGAIASVVDYHRVVVIFAPPEGGAPLAERIASARDSVFFAHHADYAAATTAERPADVMPAFVRAPHYLLDARLLQAWAIALEQSGDTQRARYVAQRLREFKNDQSAEFFAPCDQPPKAGKPLPFQCLAPTQAFTYEDFR